MPGACRAARWVASWAVPGLGMFNESYYIFSVGNIKPLWTEEYPSCWKVHTLTGSCGADDGPFGICTPAGTTMWPCALVSFPGGVPGYRLYCLLSRVLMPVAQRLLA